VSDLLSLQPRFCDGRKVKICCSVSFHVAIEIIEAIISTIFITGNVFTATHGEGTDIAAISNITNICGKGGGIDI